MDAAGFSRVPRSICSYNSYYRTVFFLTTVVPQVSEYTPPGEVVLLGGILKIIENFGFSELGTPEVSEMDCW